MNVLAIGCLAYLVNVRADFVGRTVEVVGYVYSDDEWWHVIDAPWLVHFFGDEDVHAARVNLRLILPPANNASKCKRQKTKA